MTTDTNEVSNTPRTDAARFEALLGSALRRDCIPLRLGQELERELNASQAEVKRLREENVRLKAIIEGGDFIPAGFHHRPSFREGFEFAENTLERRIPGIKKRLELDNELADANNKIHRLETDYRTLCWLKEESDKSPSPFKTWEEAMLNRGSYVGFYEDKANEANGRAYKAEAENQKLRELCERTIDDAVDALEERDLKRRIADEIESRRKELMQLTNSTN